MGRNNASTQDYGRRPELHQNIDENVGVTNSYRSMMDSLTLAEVQRMREEKQSEFEKPYRRGTEYSEMQGLHPDNWQSPYVSPSAPIEPVTPDVGIADCEQVWSDCLQKICGNRTGCGGAGVVQQMRDCAGDCSKPHEETLSCLQQNSLAFCLCCGSMHSVILPEYCNKQHGESCAENIINNGCRCPDFTLTGDDTISTKGGCAKINSSIEICASSVRTTLGSVSVVGKDIILCDSPPGQCGTAAVTVEDICGTLGVKTVTINTGQILTIIPQPVRGSYGVGDVFSISGGIGAPYTVTHTYGTFTCSGGSCTMATNTFCGIPSSACNLSAAPVTIIATDSCGNTGNLDILIKPTGFFGALENACGTGIFCPEDALGACYDGCAPGYIDCLTGQHIWTGDRCYLATTSWLCSEHSLIVACAGVVSCAEGLGFTWLDCPSYEAVCASRTPPQTLAKIAFLKAKRFFCP